MAYDDEIPRDLEVEGEYSEEEISNFLAFNEGAIIVSHHPSFRARRPGVRFKVVHREEEFLHQHVLTGKEKTYLVPADKSAIYFIEML